METATLIQTIATVAQTVIIIVTLFILIHQHVILRKTIHTSNYIRLIDIQKELRLLRINNPDIARVYSEVDGLSDTQIKHHNFNLIVLSILEIAYINKKEGLISSEAWDFWLQGIKNISKEKSFRDMVTRKSLKIVNPEFCEIVEGIVKEVEKELLASEDKSVVDNQSLGKQEA